MSGIKYDSGKAPLSLLPTKPLVEVAKVLDYGQRKYARHNWRGGMEWSRLIDASLRHITAFNDGEDADPETGISHLAHAACGLLFLLEYLHTHPEKDDRYKPAPRSCCPALRIEDGDDSDLFDTPTDTPESA